MENKLLRFGTALALLATLILGCKKTEQPWEPTPPFPGLEKSLTSYSINANTDTLLYLSDGTSLVIKAGTFSTLDGLPVDGEIELLYREFHDALDIFLAGIHMDFNSMGEKRTFQTGGMFEIDAQKDGEKLRIAENKSVDIKFGSNYQGGNYSFFYLNPDGGEWEWVDMPDYEVNGEKIDAQAAINAKSPKLFMGDEYFIFNYDSFLDIYLKDDRKKINKLKDDKKFERKLKEYKVKFNNIDIVGEVRFLRGYYHPAELLWKDIDSKAFPQWLENFRVKWVKVNDKWVIENFKIEPKGNNQFVFTFKDDNREFTKTMESVIPLKNLFKFSPDEWQKRYDEAMAEIAKEQARVDLMSETYRSFSLNRLGTYNFDRLLNQDDWFLIDPSFTISNSSPNEKGLLILGDNSGYISFIPEELNEIMVYPESNHRIFVILNDSTIAYYPVEKYTEWDIDSLRNLSTPAINFDLVSHKVTDAVSLREFLGF